MTGSVEPVEFRRELGGARVLAFSVALIGPTFAAVVVPPLVIRSAGPSAPLSFVAGAVSMALVATAFVGFALRIATAGSVIAFAGETFGARAGFVAGWMLLAYATSAVGSAAIMAHEAARLAPAFLASLRCQGMSAGALLLGCVASVREVRTAATLLLGFELLSMVVVLSVIAPVIATRPSVLGAVLTPKGSALPGIGTGTTFAILALAGFEAAAALGREARQPARAIPLAIGGSLAIASVFFILVSYAEIAAVGTSGLAALTRSQEPLQDLAERFAGRGARAVLDAAVGIGATSLVIVSLSGAGRLVLALARIGGLHGLGLLSAKHAVPFRATLAVAAAALASLAFARGTDAVDFTGDVLTIATVSFVVVYLIVGLAGAVDAARRHRLLAGSAGVLGTALLSRSHWSTLFPRRRGLTIWRGLTISGPGWRSRGSVSGC